MKTPFSKTPTGFHPSAQGCDNGATLGNGPKRIFSLPARNEWGEDQGEGSSKSYS
jgi:hypothetical protein